MSSPSAPIEGTHLHSKEGEWSNGLCGCCSPMDCGLIWMSGCCPCIQYGMTKHKLSGSQEAYRCMSDGPTWLFVVTGAFGISWVLQCLQLETVRDTYSIKGAGVKDCLEAYCCQCCSLVRTEKEVRSRGSTGVVGQQYSGETMKMPDSLGHNIMKAARDV